MALFLVDEHYSSMPPQLARVLPLPNLGMEMLTINEFTPHGVAGGEYQV